MTVPGSANPLLLRSAAPTAYQVSRSIRLNAPDSAYLSRTPGSAGNRKTWTWSGWVKRSALSSSAQYTLFSTNGTSDSTFSYITFFNDTIAVTAYTLNYLVTSAVYRDASAWMHIVVALDTTQATATNRLKLYVNGSEVTAFSTDNRSSISQNSDLGINSAISHAIGRQDISGVNYFSGYLANIEFVDGSALTPSSFAETDATTGQWVPKLYSGSYGTNGFKLTFADNSNNTASTLGADSSGNGNHWSPTNLSVTAGAGNDALTDSPTSYGSGTSGGDVRGNFCINNPLDTGSGITLANGTLDLSIPASSSVWWQSRGSIGVTSGKWYWEVTVTTNQYIIIGVARGNVSLNTFPGNTADGWGWAAYAATKYNNASGLSYGSATTSGDVVGVAYDADNSTLTFYKNGVSQGSAYTNVTTTSGPIFPSTSINSLAASSCVVNYGQRAFAYTPPANFKPLVDTYLPTPTVAKPSEVFDVIRYTGNGGTQAIPNVNTVPTTLGFSPDLVWIKNRGAAVSHYIQDVVRGTYAYLSSNSTGSENNLSGADWFSSFDSSGFTVKYSSTGYGASAGWNESSTAYVGWCWDAGTSTVTNTQGSITSQVRANPSAGFSIVSFVSGSSSPYTVGHGLNVAPEFIIFKDRDSGDQPWCIYHKTLGSSQYLLFTTQGALSSSWGGSPTSSVFYASTTFFVASKNIIAYCFAPVAGYSSFGSFSGNGSSDGPMLWLGFRPKWFMYKVTTSANAWVLVDAARSSYNVVGNYLIPNTSDAEGSLGIIDFLSNGVKIRYTGGSLNVSGQDYIWAAFAESPFQYARAR